MVWTDPDEALLDGTPRLTELRLSKWPPIDSLDSLELPTSVRERHGFKCANHSRLTPWLQLRTEGWGTEVKSTFHCTSPVTRVLPGTITPCHALHTRSPRKRNTTIPGTRFPGARPYIQGLGPLGYPSIQVLAPPVNIPTTTTCLYRDPHTHNRSSGHSHHHRRHSDTPEKDRDHARRMPLQQPWQDRHHCLDVNSYISPTREKS